MNDANKKPEVGRGGRIFASVMAVVWIAAGIFGASRGFTIGPRYLSLIGFFAVIYGCLWANVARTGRYGRIPIWP
jgi:hypothetical protein